MPEHVVRNPISRKSETVFQVKNWPGLYLSIRNFSKLCKERRVGVDFGPMPIEIDGPNGTKISLGNKILTAADREVIGCALKLRDDFGGKKRLVDRFENIGFGYQDSAPKTIAFIAATFAAGLLAFYFAVDKPLLGGSILKEIAGTGKLRGVADRAFMLPYYLLPAYLLAQKVYGAITKLGGSWHYAKSLANDAEAGKLYNSDSDLSIFAKTPIRPIPNETH